MTPNLRSGVSEAETLMCGGNDSRIGSLFLTE
jgi:hypothetical protein